MAEKEKTTGEEMNIEQTFEALEEIIGKMEAGETTLEESFKY